MQYWGDTLKSNDPEKIKQMIKGPGAPAKITDEIKSFIQFRFKDIYKNNHYTYSKQIRDEIKEVFHLSLSGEALRRLFKKLKAGENIININEYENSVHTCDLEVSPCLMGGSLKELAVATCLDKKEVIVNYSAKTNRKHELSLIPNDVGIFCYHIGILIFSRFIYHLRDYFKGFEQIIIQWLIIFLLGVKNIEQSKLIHFTSYQMIFGKAVTSAYRQRNILSNLSGDSDRIKVIFKLNAKLIKADKQSDFYFDPHTKHYTGMKKILKGWCAKIRFADKVMNMDYFHEVEGNPVYFKQADNFHDTRFRFKELLPEFREITDHADKDVLTFVIDRAIYGLKLFDEIIELDNVELITWEKGFKAGQVEFKAQGHFEYFRAKNNKDDLLKYEFEYMDSLWEKNNSIRQLIVRAKNYRGKEVEVSVLTTDLKRAANEIILLIFTRWIQENDFKFLVTHFGINEITSYKAISYDGLLSKIKDKDVQSGKYKALLKKQQELKKIFGALLSKEKQASRPNKKRAERINAISAELDQVTQDKDENKDKVSRLEQLIKEAYCYLNTENKTLFDAIKILTRNAYYTYYKDFKVIYNNYRDDHVIFQNLIQSPGLVRKNKDHLSVMLFPCANLSNKQRKIIDEYLGGMNKSFNINLPHNVNNLSINLSKKESKLFAFSAR